MADENKVFDVEIITPDRVFFTGTATMIEFNTAAGELGVYARHIPLTTVHAPGVVTIHKQGEEDIIAAVHSGFAEILPEKVIVVTIEKDLEQGFDYRKITLEGLPETGTL